MKTKKILVCGLLAVIFALAFAACEMEPEAVHEHEWGEWAVTTPATCVAKGVETSVCKLDSSHKETRDIAIDPDAHDWDEWEVTDAATCVAKGVETQTCKLDSTHTQTQEIAIDPDAHEWGEWEEGDDAELEPTCEEDGIGTITCTLCGAEDTEGVIPALGHDFQNYETTEPATCIAAGEKEATCARNGCDETDTQSIPIDLVDGHDWPDTKTTFPATETTNGVEAYICKLESSHTKDEEFTGEYATGTAGLSFVLLNSNDAYRVSRGTATGDIVIPAYYRPDDDSEYLPVTSISNGTDTTSNNAFGGTSSSAPNTTVTSITFAADSPLTTIANYAFSRCSNLASVTIPESVTSIGTYAFQYCDGLTSITIPESVTSIGTYAFQNCASLTSVTIPEGITSISNYAFQNCASLTSVNIPAGVTAIGQNAFNGCSSLTSITIPDSVTTIGQSAFQGCAGLKSINIPAGVTSIGAYAFQSCASLTSITIPASVTSIGSGGAFNDCTSLAGITVDANNPNYTSVDGILYNKAKTTLLACPYLSASGSVTIPASVTSIGFNAFIRCSSLTSITIPEGVTTIGQSAFQECAGLRSITIPASVTSISSSAFQHCTWLTSVTFVGTIPSSSFRDNAFNGDLRAKFYATDPDNGTPGTYTTTAPSDSATSVWTKQP